MISRVASEHRSGGGPGGYIRVPVPEADLLRTLHGRAGCHRAREAAEEMAATKEVGIDCDLKPRWRDLARELLGEEQEMSRLRST
jgi:hypothetical protein